MRIVIVAAVLLRIAVSFPALAAKSRPLAVVGVPGADDGVQIALLEGRTIELRVMPRPGEGYAALGERVIGRPGFARTIRKANGGRPLRKGVAAAVPWSVMRPEWRVFALAAFFPKDTFSPDGVRHVVRYQRRIFCKQCHDTLGISGNPLGGIRLVQRPQRRHIILFACQRRKADRDSE